MERLVERYYHRFEYRTGSVMNMKDLQRVKLKDAAAALILSDRTAADPDADDAGKVSV